MGFHFDLLLVTNKSTHAKPCCPHLTNLVSRGEGSHALQRKGVAFGWGGGRNNKAHHFINDGLYVGYSITFLVSD